MPLELLDRRHGRILPKNQLILTDYVTRTYLPLVHRDERVRPPRTEPVLIPAQRDDPRRVTVMEKIRTFLSEFVSEMNREMGGKYLKLNRFYDESHS